MASLESMMWLADHAILFVLILMRISGLFLTTPMLSGLGVPMRQKALMSLMLAAALYPMLLTTLPSSISGMTLATGDVLRGPAAAARVDLVGLIPLILSELAIGFVLGLMLSIPLLALEAAGALSGHQMGLSLGRVYNPGADEDADVLGQLLYFAGMGIFLMAGGLDVAVGTLIQSFSHIPIGALRSDDLPLERVTGLLTAGVELTLRVASPVTAIVLLLSVAFGAVGKTMPQINIMSVGFSIKTMAGMFMLIVSIFAGNQASSDEIYAAVQEAVAWVSGFSPLPSNTKELAPS